MADFENGKIRERKQKQQKQKKKKWQILRMEKSEKEIEERSEKEIEERSQILGEKIGDGFHFKQI